MGAPNPFCEMEVDVCADLNCERNQACQTVGDCKEGYECVDFEILSLLGYETIVIKGEEESEVDEEENKSEPVGVCLEICEIEKEDGDIDDNDKIDDTGADDDDTNRQVMPLPNIDAGFPNDEVDGEADLLCKKAETCEPILKDTENEGACLPEKEPALEDPDADDKDQDNEDESATKKDSGKSPKSAEDSGCGCRVRNADSSSFPIWPLLLPLLGILMKRRKY